MNPIRNPKLAEPAAYLKMKTRCITLRLLPAFTGQIAFFAGSNFFRSMPSAFVQPCLQEWRNNAVSDDNQPVSKCQHRSLFHPDKEAIPFTASNRKRLYRVASHSYKSNVMQHKFLNF
jgi:hypothetical protein